MPQPYPSVTLPNSQIRLLQSSLVDDTYRLYIGLPENYHRHADKTYPVVYLTYANLLFPLVWFITTSLNVDWELPRVILVGIGYNTDQPIELARIRERDLLPTRSPKARHPTGQADAFLRFIRQELQPFINSHYRASPQDSTYLGHSHAGLFGLYTLFHQPDTFNRYVIGSPSIHHDNQVALAYECAYASQHDDLSVQVFLSVGAREELDDPLIDPSFQFVTNLRKLTEILKKRNYPSLRLTSHVFEDETHVSVMPLCFSKGLRTVFA
jgi:predicted alpha/beta superfamily hydrolase